MTVQVWRIRWVRNTPSCNITASSSLSPCLPPVNVHHSLPSDVVKFICIINW